ncbi:hypothetical protein L1987_25004 [Smallanthus sonchifolius]|uniref:Uncharacterized protein n=1 Tax=Smallanthus sonchifolius TaxID=185202 RepID=A0ACB9IPP4_9ASTR|nr:hypothetical protein L1987_25004 [Smallanthus sonchifolius]
MTEILMCHMLNDKTPLVEFGGVTDWYQSQHMHIHCIACMMTSYISPSVDEGQVIRIASSSPVVTLGESSEHHPLPSEGSKTKPSEESLTPPSSVGYGGPSQVHVMDDTQH